MAEALNRLAVGVTCWVHLEGGWRTGIVRSVETTRDRFAVSVALLSGGSVLVQSERILRLEPPPGRR